MWLGTYKYEFGWVSWVLKGWWLIWPTPYTYKSEGTPPSSDETSEEGPIEVEDPEGELIVDEDPEEEPIEDEDSEEESIKDEDP